MLLLFLGRPRRLLVLAAQCLHAAGLAVEGLIGRLEGPLPFAAFLSAATGETRYLLVFAGWTAAALLAAVIAVHRDLTGD